MLLAVKAIGTLVLIGFPLHMLAISVLAPRRLWELSMVSGDKPKRRYAYTVTCMIGFGVFSYYGIHGMLDWLPTYWGRQTEDGEWMTIASSIAAMAGIAGGAGFPTLLLHSAEARLIEQERRQRT